MGLDGSACSESLPERTHQFALPEHVPRTPARAQTCLRGPGELPACHGADSTRNDARPEDKKNPEGPKAHLHVDYVRLYFYVSMYTPGYITCVPYPRVDYLTSYCERARLAPPWPLISSHLNTSSFSYVLDLSSFSLFSILFLYFRFLIFQVSFFFHSLVFRICLLYTSDAADE